VRKPERRPGRSPAWLRAAEELLRTRERVSVGAVAAAVGRDEVQRGRADPV
jgi:hypothetical protein